MSNVNGIDDLGRWKFPSVFMDKKETKLIETVASLQDEVLSFTCRLAAQESTLGQEETALMVMEEELGKLKLPPVKVPIDPASLAKHPGFAPVPWDYEGRYNLVATRAAQGRGGLSALLNGHLDVVSAEPRDLWQTDPFDPLVKDGWIYARGAGDMKSGVAAMTYAVHAVDRAGLGLKAPVVIEAVIEEECTGNGALACLAAGYEAEAALIPEPFGPTILTAQLGVVWFKVTITGAPSHVLAAPAGVNAIEKCYVLIAALRQLEAQMNQHKHPVYENAKHPLNLNLGIIKGGDWPSTVPARAEFHGRLSFFPDTQYSQIQEEITRAVRQAAENDPWLCQNPPQVEFYGFKSDGFVARPDLPAFGVLRDCHKALGGEPAREYRATCTTDLRAFHSFANGQATCFGPVAENIHAANERVSIKSIMHTCEVYSLFLARWCGLQD